MINTVIFDLGKVLVEWNWERYLDSFGFPDETRQTIAEAVFTNEDWAYGDRGEITPDEWLKLFIENAPECESEIRQVYQSIGDTIYPYDYTLELVQYYHDQGCRIFYLSNFPEELHCQCAEQFAFLEAFDGGIFSYQEKCVKPEKEIYTRLLERYEIVPEEAIFYDDRKENIMAAEHLGLKAVLFTPQVVEEILNCKEDDMKKVVKFGGSSLASAEQFRKVGEIIKADETRRYVVPSAPGKRDANDTKVTDMLYQCYELAIAGKDFDESLEAIKARYNEIINGLSLTLSLDKEFETVKQNFSQKAGSDYAASRGEYLNGIIMAAYLGFDFIDAAEVVFFHEHGEFDAEKTNEVLSGRLNESPKAVIPGFYGALPDGTIKTFSRGGSDITGSIVSKAVQADLYENWTDVSGFLIADPRIIKNSKAIEVITYRELRELAYMGATVLHEEAIFPVRKEGIPIHIKNTNAPEDAGTLIVKDTCRHPKYTITGIAGKEGFASITIEKDMMNAEVGFCRKVLQVFEESGIPFEHMPSGIDTMTVFVHQSEFEEKEQRVLADIQKAVQPDVIELESDLALIAVVGRGMRSTRGTAGRIFSALAHAHVNVKMIDQGSSELNVITGVRSHDFKKAIQAIYDIFVTAQL